MILASVLLSVAAAEPPCDDAGLEAGPIAPLVTSRSAICAWPGTLRDGAFVPVDDALDAQQRGWVAGAVLDGALVGVLDMVVESPGWDLLVVRSTDGGASWTQVGRLDKPYYYALVDDLALDRRGRLVLTLLLRDDLGSGVAAGRYVAVARRDGTFRRFRHHPR
ncbi:MAG: hypothetical protein R3F59_09420 [Myxococcota bacterium]